MGAFGARYLPSASSVPDDYLVRTDHHGQFALQEIAGDPPMLDCQELEQLAQAAHDRAGEGNALHLAGSTGLTIRIDWLPPGVEGVVVDLDEPGQRLAVIRRRRDWRRVNVAIYHETAHHILAGKTHSHGDVWLLTLALLCPREMVRRLRRAGEWSLGFLMWRIEGTRWALSARLEWAAITCGEAA